MSALLKQLIEPATIDLAWRWLCLSRRHFPAQSDIWHLRVHRESLLKQIQADLLGGRYRFSPMQVVTRADGETLALWSASDALVLKMLATVLQPILPVHPRCTHVKDHGGHKAAVRQTHRWVAGGSYGFVCKTDIRGYYANIQKMPLLDQLAVTVKCPAVLNLLGQFLFYSVENGGNFHTPGRGIPRGCALSALLAGFHLQGLDQALSRIPGMQYLRYMDDLLILAKTRWALRRAVAVMNRGFEGHHLVQHPDKTFIGRVERGFDWLGYQFSEAGLADVAPRALEHFAIELRRLYEQAQTQAGDSPAWARVAVYVVRWQRWARAGLGSILSQQSVGNQARP